MSLSKKQRAEIILVYEKWLHSYLNGDVKTYDFYLDEQYRFIGSTDNEEFLNRKDTTKFFEKTADQLAGKTDLKNTIRTIELIDGIAFITELFDAYFLIESEWKFYGRFRFTSALSKKKAGWRFIYQHFSMPDAKAKEGETLGAEQISKENQELRDAIKRRTVELEQKKRELEIEGALERIRAQAVAMKESTDLLDIVVTMRNEFINLGHEAHYFWHMMWLPETYEKAMTSGDGSKIGFVMKLPRHIHGDIPQLAKWEKSKKPTVVYAMNANEAIDYVDKMTNLGDFQNIDPQAPTHDDIRHIGGLTFIMARTTHGEIGYSLPGIVKNPPKEDIDILVKFAGAFDLAHRRFLDLQKAEKQAREVQIELALEKVRSRTMAMQHSDELQEASFLLDEQVRALSIKTWGCAFNIYGEKDSTEWFGNEAGVLPTYTVPRSGIFKEYYQKGQKGESLLIKEFSGETCMAHYEFMSSLPIIGDVLKDLKKTNNGFPTYQLDHVVFFKYGYLLFITKEHVPEAHDIFKRFAKVFEQTYTRFLDLQKAEAQAKEAKIETALEKVRSRTMAMQKGEEVKDVVVLLYKELIALGVTNFVSCGYVEINEKTNRQFTWVTNPGGDSLGLFYLPLTGDKVFDERYKAWKKQQIVFHQTVAGKKRSEHLEYAITTFNSKEAEEMVLNQFPDPTVFYCFNFSHGYLHIVSATKLKKNEEALLARFTRVFEQTYARFLDLQKAEAQAIEAQIETALERVRSRSMAMHKSDELKEVVKVIFDQMTHLKINADHAGIVVDYEPKKDFSFWVADNQDIPSKITVPYLNLPWDRQFTEAKMKGKDFFTTQLDFEEKNRFYKKLLPHIEGLTEQASDFYLNCPGLAASTVIQKDIGLYIENFSGIPFSDEENSILVRFGKVFQQTYTRFLDLQKAESQAREAQIEAALERTRTQSMLMQHSDELNATAKVFHQQLQLLGIDSEFSYLWLPDEAEKNHMFWATWSETIKGKTIFNNKTISFPLDKKEPSIAACYTAWKSDETVHVNTVKTDEVEDYFATWAELLNNVKKFKPKLFPDGLYYVDAYMKYGCFGIMIKRLLTDDEKNTLSRFSKEFERTYSSFLGLQKAETQTREAQIENALEKVRSRTMAMQNSNELPEAANNLFLQVQDLGIPAWSAGYCIWEDDQKNAWCNMSSEGEIQKGFSLPIIGEGYNFYKPFKNGEPFYVAELGGEKLVKHYDFMKKLPIVGEILKEFEEKGIPLPTFQIFHIVYFTHGYLMFITYEAVPNEWDVFKRFGKVFDQTYTRFLSLKKAEEQAKEAQIEASLERVRSKSMAMHKSKDIGETVSTLFGELLKIGIHKTSRSGIGILNESKYMKLWSGITNSAGEIDLHTGKLDMTIAPLLKKVQRAWQKQNEHFYYKLEGKELYDYYDSINNSKEYSLEIDLNNLPQKETADIFSFKYGIIYSFNNIPIPEEAKLIFKRFAKVFEQTYTRFLDIQKAEIQAREAQIEASLERVRSKTMAMQQSEELQNAAMVLFEQVEALGIQTFGSGFNIWGEDKKYATAWMAGKDRLQIPFKTTTAEDIYLPIFEAEQRGDLLFIKEQGGEELEAHYKYLATIPEFNTIEQEMSRAGVSFPSFQIIHCAFFSKGYLMFISHQPVPEAHDIFKRFAKVFEQTYTRFLDLKKAESQAREAQIEVALEKVRSRSMAMHKSNELLKVIKVISEQLIHLNIRFDSVSFGKNNQKHDYHFWMSLFGYPEPMQMKVPFIDHPVFNSLIEAYKNNVPFLTNTFSPKENKIWLQHVIDHGNLTFLSNTVIAKIFNSNFIRSSAILKNTQLFVTRYASKPFAEYENKIIARFAQVFEQSYTRFLDLQKAEVQAKKAVKQSSLDRVRAEIASMRTANDLERITPLIWKELTTLGVTFYRCGVFIIAEKASMVHAYLSVPSGESLAALHLDLNTNSLTKAAYNNWKKQQVYQEVWTQQQFVDFTESMLEQGHIKDLKTFMQDQEAPKKLVLLLTPFKQGMLYVGNTTALSKEQIELVQSLADAFSEAYARYEDFIQLENAKKNIEKTLTDLKSTQSQLIQSEKMASLGELTAGIAHEIQNPLNFVNNFSEVSEEMLEELIEEIKNNSNSVIEEIITDIKQNLNKISHHGKRASSIVKGMLDHSRTSSGVKEFTDINILADEYLRLSYHGLRAKDKTFNAEFKSDLDQTIPKIEIVAQDIGRVILNLINNSFYAVNKKSKESIEGYKPMVQLVTKNIKNGIQIIVNDNGTGISKENCEKIFQPFFTTKPTGEGTGLGLSLSYDIITKGHGGKLTMDSKKEEFTQFTIVLPIKK